MLCPFIRHLEKQQIRQLLRVCPESFDCAQDRLRRRIVAACLRLLGLSRYFIVSQVVHDFAELFEGGFEVFDDFLGENVGIGKIVGVFKAFVPEPEDGQARLVAVAFFSAG